MAIYSNRGLGREQITGLSSAKGLDATLAAKAKTVAVRVVSKGVRFRDDGTDPDASTGWPVGAGEVLVYRGDLSAIKFFETAASATLEAVYYGESNGPPVEISGASVTLSGVAMDVSVDGVEAALDISNRILVATGSTLTRPANTTPYTQNDSISDNGTAGSVTANTVTISGTNDYPVAVSTVELHSTDTGIAGKYARMWLYNSDPTASSGVVGGDNAAFSNKKAGFVGTLSGLMRAFSDGSRGLLVPDEGSLLPCLPETGGKRLWWQLQTLNDFTPSANSTTFIPKFRGYQGIP